MEGSLHDDADILAALGGSGARVLLIGRRALVALGLPVLTADYDVWIHIDDIERFNGAMAPLDFVPNSFDDAWDRRVAFELQRGGSIHLPCLDDLVLTKRWGSRPRDLMDIEQLEALRERSR